MAVNQDSPAPPGDWDRVAASEEFQKLQAARRRFIIPATIAFIVYYFALPVLVGYAPDLMKTPVIGVVNLAYLFALSQFFAAWLIAFLYLREADRFDAMGKHILAQLEARKGGEQS
ncbi:MAG: DUF485 domain-containing protein [Acidobacteriia bacterium]|nr:DUF485 domain-containing protein [Terriglobia bacterium]